MNIKPRLLIFLGIPFSLLVGVSFVLIITMTSRRIRKELEFQLQNQDNAIADQISEQVYTSARSYMSAVGNITSKTASGIYSSFLEGKLSEDEVRKTVKAFLNREKFLGGGYIYIVDTKGIIVSHPDKDRIGKVSANKDWLLKQDKNINSYHKYQLEGRNKLLYKVYNRDLDWNIIASAYVDDFSEILDHAELNRIMNKIKIGKTGYPTLLTNKGISVTHPNPEFVGADVSGLKDADGEKIIQRILDDEDGYGHFSYRWKETDGSIRDKFMYYKLEENSKLYVLVSGYTDDFYETLQNIVRIIFISGIVMGAILFCLLYGIASSVSKPIKLFTSSLKEISEGDGDLTNRIKVKSRGEIGVMVSSFNGFIDTLQSLIGKIKDVSNKTLLIKDELKAGADETAAALHEITTNIVEIKNQTGHLNENVKKSVDASENIAGSAQDLHVSVEDQALMLQTSTAAITQMISSVTNVDNITTTKRESTKQLLESAKNGASIISDTQNAVQEVNNQLENIQEMAKVISGIASQTNLLAMNAAIEAAHAGDAGKGFAVVADEIRKLAETSSSNSNRITETLKKVSNSIVVADELSQKTKESFNVVNNEINEIVDALAEISSSTSELEVGGKDILESITGLERASGVVKEKADYIKEVAQEVKKSMVDTSHITLEVVTSIEEIGHGTDGISKSMEAVTDSAFRLKETGEELKENVGRFKVDS